MTILLWINPIGPIVISIISELVKILITKKIVTIFLVLLFVIFSEVIIDFEFGIIFITFLPLL